MKKTAFTLSLFAAVSASAQERLNWQPLEVTTVKPEPVSDAPVFSETRRRAGGRLKSMLESVRDSLKNADKDRKVEAVDQGKIYSALAESIEKSFPGGVDALLQQREQMEDDIYRLLQMLPDYAYQYVGPFINDMPYVPDRILNIPAIKATRGKFPTRIAPQMKEYAEKYGQYMSTYLYIILMPEAWATTSRAESSDFKGFNKVVTIDENTKPSDLFDLHNPTLLKKHALLSPAAYRSGAVFNHTARPQTPAKKVTRTSPLTEGDVEAALTSFDDLKRAFGDDRFDEFHTTLRDMSLSDNNLMGELLNPMQTLADKISRMPEKYRNTFRETLAQTGFTPESWAITADKIIKARRVAKMSPAVALNVGTWRRYKRPPKSFDVLSPRDRQISWESIRLFVGLYTTTRENLLAVKNYSDKIQQALKAGDIMYMETPVYGIY